MAKVVHVGNEDTPVGFMPRKKDIAIYQGDDFSIAIAFGTRGTPRLNMTGWQGFCSFRKTLDSFSSVDAGVSVADDGLSLRVSIPSSVTQTMSGSYLYDLEILTPDGKKKTYMYGTATVTPQVTRG
jgi:hypothetical protein